MVGAGQGFGVPREIEETPKSISLPFGERGAVRTGKDELSTSSPLQAYLRRMGVDGLEGDFPEIAKPDGTDRTHMKDIDIIESGLEFSDKFSKMDVREKKSAYLRGMLLANTLTPITGRSSATSMGDLNLILDSGASRHMVFNPALLINRRDPPSGTGHFKAADGSLLPVAGYGDIVMDYFRIPDVYLVQELTVNLISVGQLASNHKVGSRFVGNECNLMLSGGKQIGGAIRRDDNQYLLRFLEIE